MSYYEKYLNSISKKKEVFILTAENRLTLRSIANNKILDVGICEQNLIGIAGGIAKKGGKCFLHALSNFLVSRAYEFIKINLDYQKNSCVLVGSIGGFLSNGKSRHARAIKSQQLKQNNILASRLQPAGRDVSLRRATSALCASVN